MLSSPPLHSGGRPVLQLHSEFCALILGVSNSISACFIDFSGICLKASPTHSTGSLSEFSLRKFHSQKLSLKFFLRYGIEFVKTSRKVQ